MVKNDTSVRTAIDRNLGLDRYEGNEKIYENVLKTFERNNKSSLNELKNALDARNGKLAFCVTHSLRGAAGTIGATRLANAAFGIENMLSHAKMGFIPADKANFEKHMTLLENEYNAVYAEINLFMEESADDNGCSEVMNRRKTLDLIDTLAPLLEAGDAKSVEYLDDIEQIFRPAAEGFRLFIAQMEAYDFEQAFETMNSIRQFMGTQQ